MGEIIHSIVVDKQDMRATFPSLLYIQEQASEAAMLFMETFKLINVMLTIFVLNTVSYSEVETCQSSELNVTGMLQNQ